MNRAVSLASIVVALISVLIVQYMGVVPPSVAPEQAHAAAPDAGVPDIDALAAWPAGAVR